MGRESTAYAKGKSLLFSSCLYLAWDEGGTRDVMKSKALRKTKRARGWDGSSEAQRSQNHFIKRGSPQGKEEEAARGSQPHGENGPLDTNTYMVLCDCLGDGS